MKIAVVTGVETVEPQNAPSASSTRKPRIALEPLESDPEDSSKSKLSGPSHIEIAGASESLDLQRSTSPDDRIQTVRAIAYSIQLPGSALPGDLDPETDDGKLVVSVKCGEFGWRHPCHSFSSAGLAWTFDLKA
eukprot:Skav209271  [mRNA]  locus=scaffold1552:197928:202505:+ [translate_table: standard]